MIEGPLEQTGKKHADPGNEIGVVYAGIIKNYALECIHRRVSTGAAFKLELMTHHPTPRNIAETGTNRAMSL